jgi:hypothetical protein
MQKRTWVIAGLVGVIASLATMLAVDLLGARGAYAQDSAQTGYIAVVAGPVVRNRLIPLIVVDTQAMAIMTYDYEIGGDYKELVLTSVRSFKYDRKLIDYGNKNFAKPAVRRITEHGSASVEDVLKAISSQKPLE